MTGFCCGMQIKVRVCGVCTAAVCIACASAGVRSIDLRVTSAEERHACKQKGQHHTYSHMSQELVNNAGQPAG